ALLEAMQEGCVTYGGKTPPLERPFFVLATQNPMEQAGTYPLPEAQLDRFLLQLTIGYPTEQEEKTMLMRTTGGPAESITPVMSPTEILQLQGLTRRVLLSEPLLDYLNRLVRATRERAHPIVGRWIRWGAGPRGGQSLVLAAKARALLAGRFAVTLDDIQALAAPVLRHRLILQFEAEAENITRDQVVRELIATMPQPPDPVT
ncbi:MAG: MoxR family ATPase, partial [Planctomycetota bacterium]|nr:MoxR family ATPase [Planctomycetota bacterium]